MLAYFKKWLKLGKVEESQPIERISDEQRMRQRNFQLRVAEFQRRVEKLQKKYGVTLAAQIQVVNKDQ